MYSREEIVEETACFRSTIGATSVTVNSLGEISFRPAIDMGELGITAANKNDNGSHAFWTLNLGITIEREQLSDFVADIAETCIQYGIRQTVAILQEMFPERSAANTR